MSINKSIVAFGVRQRFGGVEIPGRGRWNPGEPAQGMMQELLIGGRNLWNTFLHGNAKFQHDTLH